MGTEITKLHRTSLGEEKEDLEKKNKHKDNHLPKDKEIQVPIWKKQADFVIHEVDYGLDGDCASPILFIPKEKVFVTTRPFCSVDENVFLEIIFFTSLKHTLPLFSTCTNLWKFWLEKRKSNKQNDFFWFKLCVFNRLCPPPINIEEQGKRYISDMREEDLVSIALPEGFSSWRSCVFTRYPKILNCANCGCYHPKGMTTNAEGKKCWLHITPCFIDYAS